jgi:hypothetical protein
MPVIGTVAPLAIGGIGTAGEFLRAVGSGSCEPADVVAIAVSASGEVAADAALDELLDLPAQEVSATGQPPRCAGRAPSSVGRSRPARRR